MADDEAVPAPTSDSLSIWRYLDLAKFSYLLDSRSLFFSRASLLGDPHEGAFPPHQPPAARLVEMLPPGSIPPGAKVDFSPGLEDIAKFLREWCSVSCWFISDHESDAMWRLYGVERSAVAIKSTVGRLRKALGDRPPFQPGFGGGDRFQIGVVKYIDYSKERIPVASFAAQFFRKRKAFEHERELRALLVDFPLRDDQHIDHTRLPVDPGVAIPVDLNVLLEDVLIAADAPDWQLALVARLLARSNLALSPRRSTLREPPTF